MKQKVLANHTWVCARVEIRKGFVDSILPLGSMLTRNIQPVPDNVCRRAMSVIQSIMLENAKI